MHIVLYANEPWHLPDAAVDPLLHHTTSLQGTLADLPRRVVACGPDLVLVRGFEADQAQIDALETLCTALPGVAVALVRSTPEPDLLIRAMQAGVREVIASDDKTVIAAVISRVHSRLQSQRTTEVTPGRCIGFMPAKGGDGSTCALANLATEMAKNHSLRLLLIDLSLPFGDLEMFLTKEAGAHDLGGFSDEIDRLDGPLLEQMTHHLAPNLHMIHGPQSLDHLLHVTPAYVERLIGITRNHYDYVLIDLGLDAISLSALAMLDQLVLVCAMSLPSVRRASQIIHLWTSMGYSPDKLTLVVSSVSGSAPVALSDLEKTLGLRVSRVLPQEMDGMQASLLNGVACITLKPRSEFAKAIAAWAAEITGQSTPGKSIWQRLGIK
jgi:pilus assembly protein CpaE